MCKLLLVLLFTLLLLVTGELPQAVVLRHPSRFERAIGLLSMLLAAVKAAPTVTESPLCVRVSWGHRSAVARPFFVKLVGTQLTIADLRLEQAGTLDSL